MLSLLLLSMLSSFQTKTSYPFSFPESQLAKYQPSSLTNDEHEGTRQHNYSLLLVVTLFRFRRCHYYVTGTASDGPPERERERERQ